MKHTLWLPLASSVEETGELEALLLFRLSGCVFPQREALISQHAGSQSVLKGLEEFATETTETKGVKYMLCQVHCSGSKDTVFYALWVQTDSMCSV